MILSSGIQGLHELGDWRFLPLVVSVVSLSHRGYTVFISQALSHIPAD